MTADYVVEVVDDEVDGAGPLGVVKVIWYEISGGICLLYTSPSPRD